MKTLNNIFRSIIAIVALVASVNTAAAQTRVDTVYIEKEVVSPAAIIGSAATANNQVGCTEPVFKDGVLVTDRHAGWGVGLEVGYYTNHWTSELGSGDTGCFAAAVVLSHDWCQKTWAFAPGFDAYAGIQLEREYEGLKTGANLFFGFAPYVMIAPHSARVKIAPVLEAQCITHSNVNDDPHKLFAPFFGAKIGGEICIGNRTRSGVSDVYGYKMKTKETNPIYLTYSVKALFGKTSKKWDTSIEGENKIKTTSIEFTLGIKGIFNFYKKH